jgi:hypothetical protein
MKEGTQDRGLKQNGYGEGVAGITFPIATTGEIFADGSLIELIGGIDNGNPELMLWDGAKETVGSVVEFKGRRYEHAAISRSFLQGLMLPTRSCPHGTTRELLAEICEVIKNFVGLNEKSASLTARIVLCSAIVEAVSVAPALVIVGPDTARANRLLALLRCLCRHSVPLTGVTPAGFCSLASGMRLT